MDVHSAEKLQKYKNLLFKEQSLSKSTKITIQIKEAELSKSIGKVIKMSLFVRIIHSFRVIDCEPCKDIGRFPVWNQEVELDKMDGKNISIEVWDHNEPQKKVAKVNTTLDGLISQSLKDDPTLGLFDDSSYVGSLSYDLKGHLKQEEIEVDQKGMSF